jgi:hypothetical protein
MEKKIALMDEERAHLQKQWMKSWRASMGYKTKAKCVGAVVQPGIT